MEKVCRHTGRNKAKEPYTIGCDYSSKHKTMFSTLFKRKKKIFSRKAEQILCIIKRKGIFSMEDEQIDIYLRRYLSGKISR